MSVRRAILEGRKLRADGDVGGAEVQFEFALAQLQDMLPDDPAVTVMLDEVGSRPALGTL